MDNNKIGKIGAIITGIAVIAFALSMIYGFFNSAIFACCFFSMFIAIGFVIFMISIYFTNRDEDKKAIGLAGVAFAVIYATIIFLVYFAQCTTLNLNSELSEETLSIIQFSYAGSLYFNYDLLGYAFMALSTFLLSFCINSKEGKPLKYLMAIHGVFFISCFFMPMFPIFKQGGSDLIGTLALEVWCVYFAPLCYFGYKYFKNKQY